VIYQVKVDPNYKFSIDVIYLSRTFAIREIGTVRRINNEISIKLFEQYIPALKQLDKFSHIQVFWWADKVDTEKHRKILDCKPPYGENPPITGVFATRSEYRPNPIALTTAEIKEIDHNAGIIKVVNLDAVDSTPVIDIKAYFPVCDRVKEVKIPEWTVGWPEWFPDEGMGIFE
jgi:tRNA-Thr(GGU) m(6)t(6)A37 methyltransferase TsaA